MLIKNLRQPVLGICLGMQLMCRYSEEGGVDCLNIFDVDVKRFVPLQCIIHRTDIAGIVFYDCYFHQLNITVLFL